MTRLALVAATLLEEAVRAAESAPAPDAARCSRVHMQLPFVDLRPESSGVPLPPRVVVGAPAAIEWLASIDREVRLDLPSLRRARRDQLGCLDLTVLHP